MRKTQWQGSGAGLSPLELSAEQGERALPPFLIYTTLPRGETDRALGVLLPWAHREPNFTSVQAPLPLKLLLSPVLTQPGTSHRKESHSGCRLRNRRPSQWLTLHRPCNHTGTKPQQGVVATLNATSEYFVSVFCKQHQCHDAAQVESTEVELLAHLPKGAIWSFKSVDTLLPSCEDRRGTEEDPGSASPWDKNKGSSKAPLVLGIHAHKFKPQGEQWRGVWWEGKASQSMDFKGYRVDTRRQQHTHTHTHAPIDTQLSSTSQYRHIRGRADSEAMATSHNLKSQAGAQSTAVSAWTPAPILHSPPQWMASGRWGKEEAVIQPLGGRLQ